MQNFMINDVDVRAPSTIQYGLVPFFGATTMTTQIGNTLTGATKWKRKLFVTWKDLKDEDATEILTAIFSSLDKTIYFYDTYLGRYQVRKFTLEDEIVLPVKLWKNNKYYYDLVTIIFTEKGCSNDINSNLHL